MAGHSHDDQHFSETKPVSFTVPFILASVVILIIVLLLSVCDPKPHDAHHGMENPEHAKFEGAVHNPNAEKGHDESKGDHATATTHDSAGPAEAAPAEAPHH